MFIAGNLTIKKILKFLKVPVTNMTNVRCILGEKQSNLKHIEEATNTHMKYDEKSSVSMQIILLYENMAIIYILINFR